MRRLLLALLLLAASGAWAQLRPEEARTLDDALTLANLKPSDLGSVAPPALAGGEHVAALKDPVAGLVAAMGRHAAAGGDERALLRSALSLVGTPPSRASVAGTLALPASVPEGLRRPVGALVAAIAAANGEIRAATSRLSADEKRTLIEGLPRLALEDATVPLDYAKSPPADFATVRRLLDLVDVRRIETAADALNASVLREIPTLRAYKGDVASGTFRVGDVTVELGGRGPDTHVRKDVNLCIDLGGDDRYTGRYGTGVGYAGVLIDLGGNDRYLGVDLNFGAGLLGIGLLFDLGGEDVYGVRTAGLGCGLAGVGLLSDAAGDDRYRVVNLGLGAAIRGVGLLVDRLGDDASEVGKGGQGFGTAGGVGWCVDGGGNDTYRGGAWVQAAARADGYGLLTDLGGNDVYLAASGQASAEGGYASLGDLGGDDSYTATGSAQGYATTGGAAFLIDAGGNDSYLLRKGPGQAAAFGAVAVLFDREGDDVYGGTDGTPATALGGGVAILLDGDGDDRYFASAAFRTDADGVALWADGRGRDRYGDGREDAQARAGEGAAALDVFGAAEAPPTDPLPSPGSAPLPSPSELASLRRRATDGPDARGAISRLMAVGVPALEALAADPEGEDAFVGVAARLGTIAAPTVGRLAASPDARLARMALRTAGFVSLPPETIVGALERPALAVLAIEAAGRARTKEAVPALNERAASENPLESRAAMVALASIGDPKGASTASALIDSSDLATRRAAFSLLALSPTLARSTGLRLLSSADVTRQRIGIELLGRVGTPEALATVGGLLTRGGREAKIGALIALDGRVPTEFVATVEALRRDLDPLVRAVASRIDVGP